MTVAQVTEAFIETPIRAGIAAPSVSIEDWRDPYLRADWQWLVNTSNNTGAFFQSPQWFEHLSAIHPRERFELLALRSGRQSLVGAVAINVEKDFLNHQVQKLVLWRTTLNILNIGGGELLLPPDAVAYDQVFATLHGRFPDFNCIRLNSVPTDSFLWEYLQKSRCIHELFIRYVPEGMSPLHRIRLPTSFRSYLGALPPKDRRELERKLRRLRDHGQGNIRLECYRSADRCEQFVTTAAAVAARAWQKARGADVLENNEHWRTKIRSLADNGVLRSYILWCGNSPCAAEFACCFNGVFHGILTYYDQSFARFSPGAALLYLYLEDLIKDGGAQLVSLGSGDFSYKRWFGNVLAEDGSVLLLRKNVPNYLLSSTHRGLRYVVMCVKNSLYRRQRSPAIPLRAIKH